MSACVTGVISQVSLTNVLEIGAGVVLQCRVAVRIEVVGPHLRASFRSRYRVGPDPREHVNQHVTLAQQLHQSQMFVLEPRVPEHRSKVEFEATLALAHHHLVRVLACNQLHRQRAVLVVDAASLVHHRAQICAVFL
jgi:hypothetical protein